MSTPKVRLKSLRVHRFRGFAVPVRLEFSQQRTVFLGKNGTGKTTLLRLIAMAASSDFTELRAEHFSLEFELESGPLSIAVDIENVPSRRKKMSESVPNLADDEARWRYSLRIRHKGNRLCEVEATSNGASLHGLSEEPRPLPPSSPTDSSSFVAHVLFSIPHSTEEKPLQRDIQRDVIQAGIAAMKMHASLFRFDEALGAYYTMKGFPRQHEAIRRSSQFRLARNGASYFDLISEYAPDEIVSRLLERASSKTDSHTLEWQHSSIPFLDRARGLLGFESSTLMLQLISREGDEKSGQLTYGNLAFGFSDERFLLDTALSFGQKRLLSFFYYLAANEHIAVVDELVNGFHHEWITASLDEMGTRQCFLSSQNPLLLDELSFDSAEDAQRCFIVSRSARDAKGARTMTAENLPMHTAREFFDAYSVGVQHVSYILRSKGLW